MELERQDKVKDLGVWFDERITFKEHINEKQIDKTHMMLGVIKRNFRHPAVSMFVLFYNSMVRSHLDYCSSVWAPYMKGDIEALERVQKRATKLIPALQLRVLTYLKQDSIHSGINQDIMYDFCAQLEGTGSRSKI